MLYGKKTSKRSLLQKSLLQKKAERKKIRGRLLRAEPLEPRALLAADVSVAASAATALEGGANGAFTISRTGATDADLTVLFSLAGDADSTDYELQVAGSALSANEVTIPIGESSIEVTVVAVDDAEAERTETVTMTLAPDAAYSIVAPTTADVSILDNEKATLSVTATDADAKEGGGNATFHIERLGNLDSTLTIHFSLSGDASAIDDYHLEVGGTPVAVGSTLSLAAGEASLDVVLVATNDLATESTEVATLAIDEDAAYDVSATDSATVNIFDNETAILSVTAQDDSAAESGDDATFHIVRLGDLGTDLTMNFSVSGTADRISDYDLKINGVTVTGTSLTLSAGSDSLDVSLVANDDSTAEVTESAIFEVASGTDYTIGAANSAGVTILDNESPVVSISAIDNTAGEPSDVGTFRIERLGDLSGDLDVNFTVTGAAVRGTDYELKVGGAAGTVVSTGTLSMMAGDQTLDVTLTPIQDTTTEATEDVVVTLGSGNGYSLGTVASATANIFDDELPVVSITATDASANESGDAATFHIARLGDLSGDLNVSFTATGAAVRGTDYELKTGGAAGTVISAGTLTLAAGESTLDVTLTPIQDTTAEATEDVVLTLGTDASYSLGTSSAATASILDDDAPVVSITATDASASESGDTATFRIQRLGNLSGALDVNFTVTGAAARGTDYELKTGGSAGTVLSGTTLSLAAGVSFLDVTLSPIQDTTLEADENVVLTLGTSTDYTLGAAASASATLADDDSAVVTITVVDSDAREPGDTGTVRITRTGSTTGDLTVNFAIGGTATRGSDYQFSVGGTTVSGTSVVIPAGQTAVDVTLTPLADTALEPTETAVVALSVGSGYTVGSSSGVSLTLNDFPRMARGLLPGYGLTASGLVFRGTESNIVYSGSQRVTTMVAIGPGVVTLFDGGAAYFSPDGNNIGGGGSTVLAYAGTLKITNIVAAGKGATALFSDGRAYYSPDGQNLGGGGNSVLAYTGTMRILTLAGANNGAIALFEVGNPYFSPDGQNLGGGGGTVLAYQGTQRLAGMVETAGGLTALFEFGNAYFSPDGQNLGGGGSTLPAYTGTQQVASIAGVNGGVVSLFNGGSGYFSPDGRNLGGGGNTVLAYTGTQRIAAIVPIAGGVDVLFDGGAAYFSPNGLNLGGGGNTVLAYTGSQRITMIAPSPRGVDAVFEGGDAYLSSNGRNLGGGGDTRIAYQGPQVITALAQFPGGIDALFDINAVYRSPNGLGLGGGEDSSLVSHGTRRITGLRPLLQGIDVVFEDGETFFSRDGLVNDTV